MSENLVYIDLYQKAQNPIARVAGRPQTWRWRAINGGNNRVLGNSADAYTNRADALAAIDQLFGTFTDVYLRSGNEGNQMLRLATQLDN